MRRLISIILLLSLLLCGCERQVYELGTFSFDQDNIENSGSVRMIDTESQKLVLFMNPAKAVEIAKKYCTFGNAESSVDYDSEAGIYRVVFIKAVPMDGYVVYATGGVSVYLNDDGIVLMVVYGE